MSSLKSTQLNNVKVYTLSGPSTLQLPHHLLKKHKGILKRDVDYSRRIELIQDFGFAEASNKLQISKDRKFIMATGTYKPMIKVYDLGEMSLKFERNTNAENVAFQMLSDDWTKSVHLQADRFVEFHTTGECRFKIRIPKFGRDLSYHNPSCDLYVASSGDEVYRFNLEQGRFLNPLQTSFNPEVGINTMDISKAHHLIGFGGSDGLMEFWDPRSRSKVTSILSTLPTHMVNNANANLDVTSLKFDQSGLQMAVGLAGGQVLLYDLRGNQPYLVKDHQYSLPIKRMEWLYTPHSDGPKLATADSKILKIWDVPNGKHFTSLEPQYDINDFVHFPDSGMLMLANEGPEMHTFYIPQLGPAPKWCTFLENITEELEEQAHTTIYDDYKFVTRSELSKLGLDHLLGTRVLRGYMHGFLMDIRLYEQARLIANPFEIEEYKTRRIADKVAAERKSRVEGTKKKAKVNQHIMDKALEDKMQRSAKNKKGSLLDDDRFQNLFNDPEFEVDTASREFKLLNPNQKEIDPSAKPSRDDEDSEPEGKGSDEDSSEDEFETNYVPPTRQFHQKSKPQFKQNHHQSKPNHHQSNRPSFKNNQSRRR